MRFRKREKQARNMLVLAYREKYPSFTLEEIGEPFGLTRQRVWQILRAAKRQPAKKAPRQGA